MAVRAERRALLRIQEHLQRVYDLDLPVRVTDFLLTEGEAEHWFQGASQRKEQVLVRQQETECALGVFLHSEVLAGLAREKPGEPQEGESLQPYCHAAEGVSHFVLLVWSAIQERQVRAVDLEIQAEVDKVTTCLLTGHTWRDRDRCQILLQRLFLDSQLLPGLSAEERARYRLANELGLRLGIRLAAEMRRDLPGALAALRRFYRLPGPQKREFIEDLPLA